MSVRCLLDSLVSAFPTQLTKAKPDPSDTEDICFASMEQNSIVNIDNIKSNDSFQKETHDFVHSVVEHLVNDTGLTTINEKVFYVSRVSKEYFDRKNGNSIKEAVDLIEFNKETFSGTISRVASKMFEDEQLNWGRIIAFLVFAGKLTKKAVQRYPSDAVLMKRHACHAVSSFIFSDLAEWIINKGGWTQFVRDMRAANDTNSDSASFRTETSVVTEFLVGGALCAIPLVFTKLLLNRA